MISVVGPINTGVCAGGAGVSTNNADSSKIVSGMLLAVYIKYNDSPPAGTTDVVVKTKGTSPAPPTFNLVAVSNGATDGWYYPRAAVCDQAGAAISGQYTPLFLHDIINVSMAQANDGDSADVWLLMIG